MFSLLQSSSSLYVGLHKSDPNASKECYLYQDVTTISQASSVEH
jgi:hypothetical protein